jgi:SAM-dependent methyltransferase
VRAFKSFEIAGWSEAGMADRYDKVAGRLARIAVAPMLDALDVRAGERFLDVATGPGHLAGAAAERGARAVGLDVSADMLVLARERYSDVELIEGDAEALPFQNDSFDAAGAAFVLHHVPEPKRVAAELQRVAQRVAVAAWSPSEDQPLFALVAAAFEDAGARSPADLPRGPSRDDVGREKFLTSLLPGARVFSVGSEHEFADAYALFDGFLEGSVNTRGWFRAQATDVQVAVREAFAARLAPYRRGRAIVLPVSARIAVAVR